jgi:hypothetical protein
MVSKIGLKGSEGNEAADACATHGKRRTQPQTTGSISELMTLLTHTKPGWVMMDGQVMTVAALDERVGANKATGNKSITDSKKEASDKAGGGRARDAQLATHEKTQAATQSVVAKEAKTAVAAADKMMTDTTMQEQRR